MLVIILKCVHIRSKNNVILGGHMKHTVNKRKKGLTKFNSKIHVDTYPDNTKSTKN